MEVLIPNNSRCTKTGPRLKEMPIHLTSILKMQRNYKIMDFEL